MTLVKRKIYHSNTGGISSSGTENYIAMFIKAKKLGNSAIYQSGTKIGIGLTEGINAKVHIKSDGATNETFALKIENNADANLFDVRSDGYLSAGTLTFDPQTHYFKVSNVNARIYASDNTYVGANGLIASANIVNFYGGGGGIIDSSSASNYIGIAEGANYRRINIARATDKYVGIGLSAINTLPDAKVHIKSTGATSSTKGLLLQDSSGASYLVGQDNHYIGVNTGSDVLADGFLTVKRGVYDGAIGETPNIQKQYHLKLGGDDRYAGSLLFNTPTYGNIGFLNITQGANTLTNDYSDTANYQLNIALRKASINAVDANSTADFSFKSGFTSALIQSPSKEIIGLYRMAKNVDYGMGIDYWLNNSTDTPVKYGGVYATIASPTAGSHSGHLDFYYSASAALALGMRINNAGNIGIGLSASITGKVHIKGTGNTSSTNSLFIESVGVANMLVIGDDGRFGFRRTPADSSTYYFKGHSNSNISNLFTFQNSSSTDLLNMSNEGLFTHSSNQVFYINKTTLMGNGGARFSVAASGGVEREEFTLFAGTAGNLAKQMLYMYSDVAFNTYIDFYNNVTPNLVGRIKSVAGGISFSQGNIGFGDAESWGTNAANTIAIKNGTAPTTNIADQFAFYSADITAGNAAPHFRTETGDIVKLFKGNSIANPSGGVAQDNEARTAIIALLDRMRATGLIAA